MHRVNTGVVRAVCFDLDNTLWAIEPVLERAELILADWMRTRYPRIPERFTPADIRQARAALMLELPHQSHDLAFLSRENLARLAQSVGYDRDMAHEAFAVWHAARNQCVPFDDVIPSLEKLKPHYRLATLSNGNADLGDDRHRAAFRGATARRRARLRQARPSRLPRAGRRADTRAGGNPVCR